MFRRSKKDMIEVKNDQIWLSKVISEGKQSLYLVF